MYHPAKIDFDWRFFIILREKDKFNYNVFLLVPVSLCLSLQFFLLFFSPAVSWTVSLLFSWIIYKKNKKNKTFPIKFLYLLYLFIFRDKAY